MSKTTTSSAEEAIQKMRYDEQTRSDVEELAEREDTLGAIARVMLAVSDGERPAKSDCREAGLMSIWERYQEGGLV